MRKRIMIIGLFLLPAILMSGFANQEQVQWPLNNLSPENYRYAEAESCVNCKQSSNDIMTRAVGVDISSGPPLLDERGWLGSIHARSQSHEERINTACAWCHAPMAEGATKDKQTAKPIEKGTWQGVTCGACHPGSLAREQRKSLLVNYTPGTDPTNSENYIFIDKSDGKQFNAQCQFCHHEFHDLLVGAKQQMLESGQLRCIDCHMAGYGGGGQQAVERFHNMKAAANLPNSCNGSFGTRTTCHAGAAEEWMNSSIQGIKGPRKQWGND